MYAIKLEKSLEFIGTISTKSTMFAKLYNPLFVTEEKEENLSVQNRVIIIPG